MEFALPQGDRTSAEPSANGEELSGGFPGSSPSVTSGILAEDSATSENCFSLAFAQAPIGMVLLHPSGRIVEVNQTFANMVGYTREELTFRDSIPFTHPADVAATKKFFTTLRDGPSITESIEKRYIRRDGEILWVRASGTMRRDEQGRPVQIIAVVEDVTLKKRAEERYRFLAESIPQMVWTATPDGMLDYVNAQGSVYLGAPSQQLLGSGWLACVHPEERERTVERWKHSLITGEPYEVEFRLKRGNDGSWRSHLVRALPLTDENGNKTQWFGTCTDIEDQKQADANLHQGIEADRRRWRELLLEAPAAMALLKGPEHRFEWVNPGYERLIGRAASAIVGRTVRDLFSEVEEQIYPHRLDRVYNCGDPFIGHESLFLVDRGKERLDHVYVNFVCTPTRTSTGEIDGIFVHVTDVSDLVCARKLVEASEERFRAAAQANKSLLWTNSADGKMEGDQPGWAGFTGQSRAEYQDFGWAKAVHPDDAQPTIDAWQQALANRSMFLFEHRVRRFDGVWRLFSVRAVPVFDHDSGIREWVGVHNDITEERSLLVALQESEARFRQAIDSMPQLVWSTLPDGLPDLHNKQWFEYTGFSASDVNHKNWEPLHPDDRNLVGERWRHSIETGESFDLEFRYRRFDGVYRWFLARATPIRDQDQRIVRWFGTSTDIEERKKAELAVLTKQKLESLGLLAGGIAHDFNNLLVGVLGGASYAVDELPPTHPLQPILDDIVTAAERAAHLTRQMLAYAGKGRFLIESIDMGELVKDTYGMIKSSIPKNVQVTLEIEDSLPSVEADSGQMQQIVMNLILNAAEAIDPKQLGTVAVATHLIQVDHASIAGSSMISGNVLPGPYLVFEVRDNGSGMDHETQTRIFDPFFTTKFTGRGLGLSAVHGILRTHNGALELNSRVGHGSTFRVFLPASNKRVVDHERSSQRGETAAGTVLLVDDEEVVRRTGKTSLERAGFQVELAENGEQAVARLLDDGAPPIHLVVLDMSMPAMNGKDVMEQIRLHGISVPVLICSGYSEAEISREFTGLDIAGFIQKPFTSRQLLIKAQEAFPKRKKQ